jgi:NAD(P)H-hydrate epimerase
VTPPRILTRDQCRQVDRRAIDEYGLPGLVLMENAGRGVAERLVALGARGPIVICCGRGNNGGDGLVIARHLDLRGVPVRVLLWGRVDDLHGDAAVNARIVRRAGLPLVEIDDSTRGSFKTAGDCPDFAESSESAFRRIPLSDAVLKRHRSASDLDADLAGAEWIVDALLGTGAVGPPRGPLADAIRRMNATGRPILAVDIPSGLDCDTGQPADPTIRAARTCTFVALKPGLLMPAAQPYTGPIDVIDIGVPRRLLDELTG